MTADNELFLFFFFICETLILGMPTANVHRWKNPKIAHKVHRLNIKKIPQKNNNSNCNLKRLLPFLSDKELYKIFSHEFPVAEGSVNKSTIWQGRK